LPNFVDVLRALPQIKDAFKDFSNEEILKALSDGQEGGGNPNEDPRIAEFDMMATGAPVIGSDGAGSFFYAETLPLAALELQPPWDAFLKKVVRVHRF
jgi:hypothetical protein